MIHFARIDGEYLIAGPAYEEIARGFDFTAMVRNMVARHPLIRRSDRGENVSIHPAALLVAVVGTAFFKTGEARADRDRRGQSARARLVPLCWRRASSASLTGGARPPPAVAAGACPADLRHRAAARQSGGAGARPPPAGRRLQRRRLDPGSAPPARPWPRLLRRWTSARRPRRTWPPRAAIRGRTGFMSRRWRTRPPRRCRRCCLWWRCCRRCRNPALRSRRPRRRWMSRTLRVSR
ncbi:hypothetical protein ACRAWD_03345 [Caulobacter segnis]